MHRSRWTGLSAALLLLAAAACSPVTEEGAAEEGADAPLRITATTGMVADAARAVGGPDVVVEGLMGPGVDPHLYRATQSDLRRLSDADLILYNGLHLEGKLADILERFGREKPTVAVAEAVPEDALMTPEEYEGSYDPHVWFDVRLWMQAVARVAEALRAADPQNAEAYAERATEYQRELEALDAYVRERVAEVPASRRVLITAHDAFGYFGRAYGIEVMGLQGINTVSEYGVQDMERLLDVIVERGVKAVFVETSISPRSIEALVRGAEARGHEVAIGGALYSDALGEVDGPAGTYVGMVRHNVDTIVEALR
jgi:manganese/zinc/iron transport system substrate-binding protein